MTEPVPTVPPPRPASAVPPDGVPCPLDERVLAAWRLGALVSAGGPLLVASVTATLLLPTLRWLPAALAAVLLGVVVGPWQRARWRRWSWMLTDTGVELSSGVLVHRRVTLPHFRVQQIDVIEGPLERLLGLATLTVTTASAGGSVSLPGLAAERAAPLRAALMERAARASAELSREGHDAV
jgi:membrane protein YdbS with pleckstrin-like domain